MREITVQHESKIDDTYRVQKIRGSYDLPERKTERFEKTAQLHYDEHPWQIGAIIGGSGSGKSSLMRALWDDQNTIYEPNKNHWSAASLVDDFPDSMTATAVTSILTSVGLSSVPEWVKPYSALSTGQQHRCDIARALAESETLAVVDEFTSTVDRVVAKAISTAVSKYVRRTEQQFVAVTCHKDIIDWLQPDWVFDTDTYTFSWRSVQPRPEITLRISEGIHEAWELFRDHHYLNTSLAKHARVFLGYVTVDNEERLATFQAIIPSVGHKGWWSSHRIVVLPDMQGLGLGMKFIEEIAEQLWTQENKRFRAVTSHPGVTAYRRRHPEKWVLKRKPSRVPPRGKNSTYASMKSRSGSTSVSRLTTSWDYVPKNLRK